MKVKALVADAFWHGYCWGVFTAAAGCFGLAWVILR